ncbi:sulfite exporter TauE/SafE family protein [Nocardioides sp.]|uniref:sulfite exporter TauE/SafE family protein n=1 Tax=Nocardioides sp. TaxID=35761 RepID=UPI0035170F5F
MEREALGFLAGMLVAAVTAPVGVSGAVFLLPVQLSVLHVPNPQVTPTNLLYNVVSGPGALLRYVRQRRVDGPLTRALVLGSAPGVALGAALRVHVVADPDTFRLLAAAVLLPTGLFILLGPRRRRGVGASSGPAPRTVTGLAFVVGVVGGIYGVGGGSILGPILVGSGMTVARVAPAALASTFITSIVGVVAFAGLALTTPGTVAPDWSLGLAIGAGGIVGGYAGARLQPRLPEALLRGLLGSLAIALAALYLVQSTV